MADDVLRQAVQGISELVTEPGLINVDFAHVRQLMKLGGGALMAIGRGKGDDKVRDAVHNALNHPLLESVSLHDAAGIIANFTGGKDLSLFEIGEALGQLQDMARDNVDIVMGVTNNERLYDRVQVILVITGLGAPTLEDVLPGAERINPMSAKEPDSVIEQSEPEEMLPFKMLPGSHKLPSSNDLDLPAFMRRRNRYTDNPTRTRSPRIKESA
jgi:cell division protein FtsZ